MSLNNIELNDALLSELYKGSLIAGSTIPSPPEPKAPQAPPSPSMQNPPQAPPSPSMQNPQQAPPAPSSAKTSPAASKPQEAAPAGYKFLGNNKRNITIIVQSLNDAFLPDDQLAFLGKMLEACKMNLSDVAIVNHAVAAIDITDLKAQLRPAFVLLFGVGPVDIKLPLNFPVFRVQPYDECTYLSSPSLAELLQPGDEGKKLKGGLWAGLKTMFNI